MESLSTGSYYAANTLLGVRTVDEDGKEMTVYTDRLGRKVLERRGPESKKGQNDTYFVYNALGQLRFVLSPSYQESADLTEYAYEYRYDQHGNIVYKAIPGAGYTQYWYDRAGRLAYMQDANLRASSLFRFFLYDKAGRQVIQGVCKTCTRDETVNVASYTGGTTGFLSTGYTLANASRIQQATLESVAYFDAYSFASTLDSHLVKSGTASATGLQTGAVVYASDGSKSLSAIYYDSKGQVIENREVTNFGTKRTTTSTYNYSGQPLKTTLTEGSVSLITENTYDAASGLLTATDVTVNGVKQRVSAVTYDDLGRIKSVKRGNATNSGGTVDYTYNIHGQTKTITGPGFTQNLYYADGNGTKLYNGSVSSMTWKMGTDATIRGYKYTYNDYSWLTASEYGETDALTSNKDRYTEKMTSFTRNGGVKALQRYGKQSSGTYGYVDNLSISYKGNRISGVSDAAPAVTQNGSMDFPGGSTSSAFSYNAFGALASDASRGITSISYDNFGNPKEIVFSKNARTSNVYSAAGEKLKTSSTYGYELAADATSSFDEELGLMDSATPDADTPQAQIGINSTEYHGPVIYRNGAIDMVLFPGGYATINGTAVTFHYYTQDYLCNNRAVINGSTGAIEQTIAYYAYGGVIADLGTPTTGQPYKFGGKELLSANGLNEYDFGARNYYPAIPGFTSIDPRCEDFSHLSPYLFCGNNPVNNVDPTGEIFETLWDIGNVLYDIGAAAYNHVTGNHDKAIENWVDAGVDGIAAVLPGVPAGISKLGKVAKTVIGKADNVADAVSEGKKVAKGMKNADAIVEGKEYNGIISSDAIKKGLNFSEEPTIVPILKNGEKGRRSRPDMLIKDTDGLFIDVENKLFDTTPLSPGQNAAKKHIQKGSGMFEIRSTKINQGLQPGDIIQIKELKEIINILNLNKYVGEKI